MKINIDIVENTFVLTGDIDTILSKRRALLSFKRLSYKHIDSRLVIPYNENTKIHTLQTIERILNKFYIGINLGEATKQELISYDREQENFTIFSEKAKKIRNNEFSN